MRKEEGQALAEYHVLYPGAILISIAALWVIGGSVKDTLRRGINTILDNTSAPSSICLSTIMDDHGGSNCSHDEKCDHIKPEYVPGCTDFNSCSVNLDWNPGVVVIKAGLTYSIFIEDPNQQYSYTTEDGCYQVVYDFGSLQWTKEGSGPGCQNVSHVEAWYYDSVVACE